MSKNPLIFAFTGPSGVGKTTACLYLEQRSDVERVVTTTTRNPRHHEEDGIDYHFLTEKEMGDQEHEDLPNIEYEGMTYGYPRRCFESRLERGTHCVIAVKMDIEKRLRDIYGSDKVVAVLLIPPTFEDLEKRLKGDGRPPKSIEGRLQRAKRELDKDREHFDKVLISDTLESLYKQLDSLYDKYT